MLNELSRQLRQMTAPKDTVICAVSGGADSVALLFGAYLLKDELDIHLEAAHFNHGLRGAESEEDEAFVRELCSRFDIPLHMGGAVVKPGKKGLEAAAREARYAFFATLDGKIATAHTADDNAETVLMHLIRGTGLKGLGGIAPVNGRLIRPLLRCNRQQILEFVEEYNLSYRTDSSNETDAFLRNRLRHQVMPLLKQENPKLAENVSAMALRLRQDEAALAKAAEYEVLPDVTVLRKMHSAVRSRVLERFLRESGVKEPEAQHIMLAESLIFSDKPSAQGHFPNGVIIARNYDQLLALGSAAALEPVILPDSGTLELPQLGLRVTCGPAKNLENSQRTFTVHTEGPVVLRCRQSGDTIRLAGGTKSVKKLFVDRKIPAHCRLQVPVLADDKGLLAVYDIGVNLERAAAQLPAAQIRFEHIKEKKVEDQPWKK